MVGQNDVVLIEVRFRERNEWWKMRLGGLGGWLWLRVELDGMECGRLELKELIKKERVEIKFI